MGIREAINKNPAVGGTVVAVLLVAAAVLAYILTRPGPDRPSYKLEYYFSVKDGKLFADKPERAAPFKRDDGSVAVRAHVYGCGGCDGETFLGYLSKYSDEAIAVIDDESFDAAVLRREGMLVRLEGDDPEEGWVKQLSDEGLAKTRSVVKKCDAKTAPRPCFPKTPD